jgi:hypothetical protein
VWTCWADSFLIWLFTAEMFLPLSRQRGVPVLAVTECSEQGSPHDAGHWMVDRERNWQRCAD